MQTEIDTAKEALKQQTGALTEKARAETNIDAQIQQLQEQAGQQITGAESAKAQYITSRKADLEDSYKQQKSQLDQQNFQNQMSIAQFGLTKESETFSNWLSSMSLATDMWYKDQSLSLDKMAQEIGANANAEALNWDKTKYYDTQARNAAASSGASGNQYENMVQITLDDGSKVWVSGTTAWNMQEDAKAKAEAKLRASRSMGGGKVGSAGDYNTDIQNWIDTQALTSAAANMGNTQALKNVFGTLQSSVY